MLRALTSGVLPIAEIGIRDGVDEENNELEEESEGICPKGRHGCNTQK